MLRRRRPDYGMVLPGHRWRGDDQRPAGRFDRPKSVALCIWYETREDSSASGVDKIYLWDGSQDFTRLGVSKPKFVILPSGRTSGKISTKINYDTTPEAEEQMDVLFATFMAVIQNPASKTEEIDIARAKLAALNAKLKPVEDQLKGLAAGDIDSWAKKLAATKIDWQPLEPQ